MINYYELLNIPKNASRGQIKAAFREKAKQLHPDIAGEKGAAEMRKLLVAYQTLYDQNRRFEYDRLYNRLAGKNRFDYRSYLREKWNDPASQAKLIFYELLHLEEDAAISVWQEQGGLDFLMEKFMDREDWMDCSFILAEELLRRKMYYEAFVLLVKILREERRLPYFRHFMEEVENVIKEIVRLHLKQSVNPETYVECLEALLDLGFDSRYKARILRNLAEAFIRMGEMSNAEKVFREAIKLDPKLPNTIQLRRKLHV